MTGVAPASPAESLYSEAMEAYLSGDFDAAFRGFRGALKKRIGAVSAELFAGLSAFQLGRVPDAIPHLERVVEAEQELPDALMALYVPSDQVMLRVEVAVVEGIYVSLELDSLAAALLLAEAYQSVGQREKALALMGDLLELDPADEAIRLSLCDLLFEAADFDRTIDVASADSPRTNLGFCCHIFKAQAQSWLGDWQATKETFESALSGSDADDENALKVAREGLARSYEELGLSAKRLTAFHTALMRKRKNRPSGSVAYESQAYERGEPDDSGDPA
jgi:tetratricopeptide (TPR) repeat protein